MGQMRGRRGVRSCGRCLNESMRLYPHPPVLLRRANVPDELPGACDAQYWRFGGSWSDESQHCHHQPCPRLISPAHAQLYSIHFSL